MRFNGTFIGVKTSKVRGLELDDIYMGESMKKGASHTKVKVLSKDYISRVAIVYWFTLHFSHNFLNRISNLRPNG
jgi:hypothetical protein